MKLWETVKDDFKTDVTWNRVVRLSGQGLRALPSASGRYLIEKVPIVQWLPRYDYRWAVNDLIAGLTLGLMLIPQGLSYAKIATIPVEYGLMSSWLPSLIYAFMGSTKDVSTGPTSLIGLLTAEAILDLKDEYTPSEVASAMALMMGIYGMVLGFLKLGFLLEFISLPILSGFISAVAITIALNQMDSLLGEENVGDGTATQIHDIFHELPNASGLTCAIGFTGILLLVILEQAGKRWGSKNKIIWFLGIARAFICLVLFTGVSYGVNKNRDPDDYLFGLVKLHSNGLETPRVPKASLVSNVASRGIAVFIAASVEHTAIARAFGVRNNYVVDQSQELCYIGIINLLNSILCHAMGVGGAMSRTSVNNACHVKSPLSGLMTTAVVLVSIYKLAGALYWIPKATLSAIIITAVWPLISPPKTFYKFWKGSLGDFISSMIAFWVSLFVSTEIGIASSVGFNIVYCILRQVFSRMTSIGADSRSELAVSLDNAQGMPSSIPEDTRIFRFNESFFFPNAFRLKSKILDSIQTFHAPAYSSTHGSEAHRNWSVVGEKRVARLRREQHITDSSALPPIRLVILDFTKVNHTDLTAVSHMQNFFGELKNYAGADVEVRFVGMTDYVKQRFDRAGFAIVNANGPIGPGDDKAVRLYRDVASAVFAERRRTVVETEKGIDEEDDDEKVTVTRKENV